MIQQRTLSMFRRGRATRGHVVLGASLVMLLSVAVPAQAQIARFKSIRDAVPLKFFNAATTAPDPSTPNKLIIGFNTGLDPTTFISNQFVVSSTRHVAMDTISFTVNAPIGFYVSRITFTQRGTGWTCRTCSSGGAATWVVAGHPASLGVFTNNPALSGTVDLTALKLGTVPVSITDSLFATTGSVTITGADVVVQLLPR
jgi:hypothetical protein